MILKHDYVLLCAIKRPGDKTYTEVTLLVKSKEHEDITTTAQKVLQEYTTLPLKELEITYFEVRKINN